MGSALQRWAYGWAAALVALLAMAGPALAQVGYPPRSDPAINDLAGVLGASERAAILAQREALREATGAELVVATIGAVSDYDRSDRAFEEFATGLFNAWGIGSGARNDGVLLLVAVQDRRVRIEVGKGLGSQYNAAMQALIDDEILPAFRGGDYGAGVVAGARGIRATLVAGPAAAAPAAPWRSPIVWLGGGIALAGVAGTAYAFWQQLQKPRRRCPKCQAGMRLLREHEALAQLSPGQQAEIRLNAASYRIWHCRQCGHHRPERTLRYSSGLTECPSCHSYTLASRSYAAPPQGKGKRRRERRMIEKSCHHCHYHNRNTETVAAATAHSHSFVATNTSSYDSTSSSYSSSSSYDSSSSTSDSGGSSSGDGASGSW